MKTPGDNIHKNIPANVINISERRAKKNAKPLELGLTTDGYIIHPPEKMDITLDEALKLSDDIINKYHNTEILFEDYKRREKIREKYDVSFRDKTDLELKNAMESSLDFQRKSVKLETTTTNSLIRMLALHKENPLHYYGITILPVAEELRKRLNSKERK